MKAFVQFYSSGIGVVWIAFHKLVLNKNLNTEGPVEYHKAY